MFVQLKKTPVGPKGPQGLKTLKGPQGLKTLKGPQGLKTLKGPKGPKGLCDVVLHSLSNQQIA